MKKYVKIYDMWEAMGLLPSTRASTVQSSWTRRSWSPFEPRFWCHTWSIGWSVILDVGLFSSVGSAFGTKIRAMMSSSFQQFWDHPGIRTIHAQDFKIKFSEPKSSWLVSLHPAWDIWDPLAHLFAKVGPTAGGTWQLG